MGIPTGELASSCTPKGPNSDRPNRMVMPRPEISNPPLTPMKKIRSLTGVSGGARGPINWSFSPILRMPPTNPASSSPPNTFALILTPMEAISMIGNWPLKSLPRSIFTPSMVPENSAPGMPSMDATLAERVRMKSRGLVLMSRHSMPISLILMGSHSGQPTPPPVADSMPKKTPNPGLALKLPLARKAKFRPSPLSLREATLSSAPMDTTLTTSSVPSAPVSTRIPTPLSARNSPNSIRKVSTSNLKESTLPSSSNVMVARMASVL